MGRRWAWALGALALLGIAVALARDAGADHLLLTHGIPPLPLPGLESVFLDGVGEVYGGGVTLGRDGTAVSLPAGSEAVLLSRL